MILAVGRKEMEDRSVTLRRLGESQTSVQPLDAVIDALVAEAIECTKTTDETIRIDACSTDGLPGIKSIVLIDIITSTYWLSPPRSPVMHISAILLTHWL